MKQIISFKEFQTNRLNESFIRVSDRIEDLEDKIKNLEYKIKDDVVELESKLENLKIKRENQLHHFKTIDNEIYGIEYDISRLKYPVLVLKNKLINLHKEREFGFDRIHKVLQDMKLILANKDESPKSLKKNHYVLNSFFNEHQNNTSLHIVIPQNLKDDMNFIIKSIEDIDTRFKYVSKYSQGRSGIILSFRPLYSNNKSTDDSMKELQSLTGDLGIIDKFKNIFGNKEVNESNNDIKPFYCNAKMQDEFIELYNQYNCANGVCETLNGELIRATRILCWEFFINDNDNLYDHIEDEFETSYFNDDNNIEYIKGEYLEMIRLIDKNVMFEMDNMSLEIILDYGHNEKFRMKYYTQLIDKVVEFVLSNKDSKLPYHYDPYL